MRALSFIVALLCASCSSNIFVVDESGNPIEDAKVIPMTRSFDWPAKYTDEKGGVLVTQDIPSIHFVRVVKPGYRPHPPVNYNLPKPITVVLKR